MNGLCFAIVICRRFKNERVLNTPFNVHMAHGFTISALCFSSLNVSEKEVREILCYFFLKYKGWFKIHWLIWFILCATSQNYHTSSQSFKFWLIRIISIENKNYDNFEECPNFESNKNRQNEIEHWMGEKKSTQQDVFVNILRSENIEFDFSANNNFEEEYHIIKWYRDVLMKRSIKSRKSNCTHTYSCFHRVFNRTIKCKEFQWKRTSLAINQIHNTKWMCNFQMIL